MHIGGSLAAAASATVLVVAAELLSARLLALPAALPVAESAFASGRVVDYARDTPLAGIAVSIASYVRGAAPVVKATTDESGYFSFTAGPGEYLMTVGSGSSLGTRATLHEAITLAPGMNTVEGMKPVSEPDVLPTLSQKRGALRLMALSPVAIDCVKGANQGRLRFGLRLLVPDEYLEEDAIAVNTEQTAQNTDLPVPLFGFTQPYGVVGGLATSAMFERCAAWTGLSYSYRRENPPYRFSMDPGLVWFGASFVPSAFPKPQPAGKPAYGVQLWAGDPR